MTHLSLGTSFQPVVAPAFDFTTVAPYTREEMRSWGYDYLYGSDLFDRTPDRTFMRSAVEPEGLKHFLGFELEFQWQDFRGGSDAEEAVLRTVKRKHPYLYFVYDCTIGHGVEIVSQPMSYRFFQGERKALKETVKWLASLGCRSFEGGECGLHVHQSRDAFTDAQLYRFELFLVENEKFAKKLSQRVGGQMQWCRISPADYEMSEAEVKSHKAFIRKKVRGTLGFNIDCKNVAVNTGGYDEYEAGERGTTVELRLMRGTLHPVAFAKGIEFAVALNRFAARTPCKSLKAQIFVDWVKERRKAFPNLHQYMQDHTEVLQLAA